MKYAICTISFRHQLVSFADLVCFAHDNRFDGIELWGVHARHLYESEREATREQLYILHGHGMCITMISDYPDISSPAPDGFSETMAKCRRLIEWARWFGTNRIRTFAGRKPSARVTPAERALYARRLHALCDLCGRHGMELLLETHPDTLTDNPSSTLRLLEEVDHEALKINLDFLHLWESGADPIDSFTLLEPWVRHYHLKNVVSTDRLGMFSPHQVYSPSGDRAGIVPLSEGAVDYRAILEKIRRTDHFASLEWFGPDPGRVLREEIAWLRRHTTPVG